MDLSQLKTQVTTMFLMSNRTSPNDNPYSAIWVMMYTMVFISLIEWLFRMLPIIGNSIKEQAKLYATSRNSITQLVSTVNKEVRENSVTLVRSFGKNDGVSLVNDKVDAVIDYLTKIDNSRHIKIHNRYFLNNRDVIAVTPQISAKVVNIIIKDDELNCIELRLFSDSLQISQLNAWIDDVYDKYCIEKRNNLGNKRFYFNEHAVEPMKELLMDKTSPKYRWETAPKTLTFHMNEFSTSKSLANVFGDHISELKDRIDLFLNHPDWYAKRGIPHSLGILLHGLPGCGKTSTIKAIAKDTNRHIINLTLRKYTTQRQLLNLFQNETISVLNSDGTNRTYNIPLDQRIYVIEDIDCLTDVVLERGASYKKPEDDNELNLSFILNLLDGVLETPGRVLIMTTNHVDKLDKALIRPGRIDVNIRFERSKRKLILDMVNNFYNIKLTQDDIPESLDMVYTPAEVIEVLCLNYNNYKKGLETLVSKAQSKSTPSAFNTKSDMIADTDEMPQLQLDDSITTAADTEVEKPSDKLEQEQKQAQSSCITPHEVNKEYVERRQANDEIVKNRGNCTPEQYEKATGNLSTKHMTHMPANRSPTYDEIAQLEKPSELSNEQSELVKTINAISAGSMKYKTPASNDYNVIPYNDDISVNNQSFIQSMGMSAAMYSDSMASDSYSELLH